MSEMNDIMNESFGINEAIKKQKQDLIIQDLKFIFLVILDMEVNHNH